MSNSPALTSTRERPAQTMNGWLALALAAASLALGIWQIITMANSPSDPDLLTTLATVGSFLAFILLSVGLFTLQPNEGAAILLFGAYKGTDRNPGLRWMWPWFTRTKVSLRVRNETSETLKVNDRGGNPIEIAAVVVWRVVDTGQALFDVDSYPSFVTIQIETALREIASHFAYDHAEDHEPTLRADGDKVAALLREKLQDRVHVAGVVVDEAKLSHLAYAPEIASAMLRRQQAEAILAARQKIVQGAVSMVEDALNDLASRKVVTLDDDRRAAMVSNLLVVLCAEREATPVINAGTLYG
jgi:uncharacterized membrane protein YqjE